MIQSVGLGSTQIYVDHLRPMFNAVNEDNATPLEPDYQNDIRFNTQTVVVGAGWNSSVAFDGTITDVIINNVGSGYTQLQQLHLKLHLELEPKEERGDFSCFERCC